MEDIVLVTSGISLLVLAVKGYHLDRATGRKPVWWLHVLNFTAGMAAIVWVVYDYLR